MPVLYIFSANWFSRRRTCARARAAASLSGKRPARSQQGQRRVLRGREFDGDLPELACRLNVVARLEPRLREVIPRLRQLGTTGWEFEADTLQDHLRTAKIAVPEQVHGTGKIDVGLGDRGRTRNTTARMTGRHPTQCHRERQHADLLLHRHSGSAFPNALSFSCARCEIVSPGVPPTSACR